MYSNIAYISDNIAANDTISSSLHHIYIGKSARVFLSDLISSGRVKVLKNISEYVEKGECHESHGRRIVEYVEGLGHEGDKRKHEEESRDV